MKTTYTSTILIDWVASGKPFMYVNDGLVGYYLWEGDPRYQSLAPVLTLICSPYRRDTGLGKLYQITVDEYLAVTGVKP